jgi:hypothetical protein
VADVDVGCEPATHGGWRCRVTVADGRSQTSHDVRVSPVELARYGAPAATEPTDLVRASFAFLLAREPKESILRAFDLGVIERYFPDFRAVISGGR